LRSIRGSCNLRREIERCAGTQLEQCQENLRFQCLATRPKRLILALLLGRRPGTAIAKQHRRLPSPKPDSACATRDCGSTRLRRVFPGRPVRGVVRTTPETSRLGATPPRAPVYLSNFGPEVIQTPSNPPLWRPS